MSDATQSTTNSTTISVQAGDTVCRPPTWVDVAKFFLFNYGLHALTVVTPPGSGSMETMAAALSALILPFSGTLSAIVAIYRCARSESDPLKSAQQAGALCMKLKGNGNNRSLSILQVDIRLALDRGPLTAARNFVSSSAIIHGQHFNQNNLNTLHEAMDDAEIGLGPSDQYRLFPVPRTMKVAPLGTLGDGYSPLQLASNHSYIKGCAAILQILYGSWELWRTSDKELARWGYAAYPLTVAPYLIMSLINLLATLCQDQYPAMFLVKYGGSESPSEPAPEEDEEVQPQGSLVNMQISSVDQKEIVVGAIGQAYGALTNCSLLEEMEGRMKEKPLKEWTMCLVSLTLVLLSFTSPYIVIYSLTRFGEGKSTKSQRAWLMTWLVIGQVYGGYAYHFPEMLKFAKGYEWIWLCTVAGLCAPAIGGFVVVAQMILQGEVCVIL